VRPVPRAVRDLAVSPFADPVTPSPFGGTDTQRALIDLSRGNPDLPPPRCALSALRRAAERDSPDGSHRYPPSEGLATLREAAADWYCREHRVELDPDTEVAIVPGTRAAITLLTTSAVDTGELVLVPQPGYPDYNAAATLAGATAIPLVLDPANDYQPDWACVAALEPALVVLNYPANPCTACEKPGTFETAVEYCRTRRAWLMHDFAYGFLSYSGRARSVLEVEGAREVSVELWSASKIFGMAGWRIGFAVGNAVLIQRVKRLVHQYVAGIWPGFQDGLLAAMNDPARDTQLRIAAYRRRRDLMLAGLGSNAIGATRPEGTFYVWCHLPDSATTDDIMRACRVLGTPGPVFGAGLDAWMRLSLTAHDDVILEATSRLSTFST
jgi:aminotransferase